MDEGQEHFNHDFHVSVFQPNIILSCTSILEFETVQEFLDIHNYLKNVLEFTGSVWLGGVGSVDYTQVLWIQGGGSINTDFFNSGSYPTVRSYHRVRYRSTGGWSSPANPEAVLEVASSSINHPGLCEIFD